MATRDSWHPSAKMTPSKVDAYELLGLASREASDAEIKKAYRRLSVKHHPDKGGDAAAFKELTSAYEVLSDGERRALYDVGGMSAVEKGAGGRDMFGRSTGVPKGCWPRS